MSDFIRIRDKRYKSSSSLGGGTAEKSVRKVYKEGSIQNMDDKIAEAEEKCDKVKRKISLLKKLKKIKPKRRKSITTVNKHSPVPRSGSEAVIDIQKHQKFKDKPIVDLFTESSSTKKEKGYRQTTLFFEDDNCSNNDKLLVDLLKRPKSSSTQHDKSCGQISPSLGRKEIQHNGYITKKGEIPRSNQRRLWQSTSALQNKYKHNRNEHKNKKSKERTSTSMQNLDNGKMDLPQQYLKKHYELPTTSSQLKKTHRIVYEYKEDTLLKIPFISSTSTSPSHHVGVNLSRVLSGMKLRQPSFGIPSTMAHHMGLSPVASRKTKSDSAMKSTMASDAINVIKLGRRSLVWPIKKMSFNRLLKLYEEGDGAVSRFLRSLNKRTELQTPTYDSLPQPNLNIYESIPSKLRGNKKHNIDVLEEYLKMFREYKFIEESIENGNSDAQHLSRLDELYKELEHREEAVCKILKDCPIYGDLYDTSAICVSNPRAHKKQLEELS